MATTITPIYSNGYSAYPSSYPLEFVKSGDSVTVRGKLYRSAGLGGYVGYYADPTDASVFGRMRNEFRPSKDMWFKWPIDVTNDIGVELQIRADGKIYLYGPSGLTNYTAISVSFTYLAV